MSGQTTSLPVGASSGGPVGESEEKSSAGHPGSDERLRAVIESATSLMSGTVSLRAAMAAPHDRSALPVSPMVRR
jgi:hypothetical protein